MIGQQTASLNNEVSNAVGGPMGSSTAVIHALRSPACRSAPGSTVLPQKPD